MRVLLIGGSGQVGQALLDCKPDAVECIAPHSAELNLENREQVRQWIAHTRPHLIINAAAYTAVDNAECEPERAFQINAAAVAALAAAAAEANARLFQLSTDYVFDGNAEAPYPETAACHPLSVYGASKLAGEQAVLELGRAGLVMRTSWVFSSHGSNFVKTMLRLGAERKELGVVDDQIGGPTPAGAIATALWQLADHENACGIYHLSGTPSCSWYTFAGQIFADATACRLLPQSPALSPITSAQFPTAARRPGWSVLDCSKLKLECGITQPDWRPALRAMIEELASQQAVE